MFRHKKKEGGGTYAIVFVALLCLLLAACGTRLTDGAVSSGSGDTFNAAGESTWSANTGAFTSGGAKVDAAYWLNTGLPSGWTSATGAVHVYSNSSIIDSGTGTASDPYVIENMEIYGCISIHVSHVKLHNVSIIYDQSTECYSGPQTSPGIVWVADHAALTDSYIHDVAQLHRASCNGYNDGTTGCIPDDYHRDTIFAQGASYYTMYDDYIVHSHKHYISQINATDFTDHSSGGCLCDAASWGASHDAVWSNIYINGGGGHDMELSSSNYHFYMGNIRFDDKDHDDGVGYVSWHSDSPCNMSDHHSGDLSWTTSSTDGSPNNLNGSYFYQNSAVDGASAGAEVQAPPYTGC
jgi:hypothetical protein